MKILLIAGHGAGDSGAIGNGYREADLTREFAAILQVQMSEYCTCELADISKDWFRETNNGNFMFSGYDYMLELHFNSGGGTGVEIYVPSSSQPQALEEAIVKNISDVTGLINRGVKRKNFNVIAAASSRGIRSGLLEICFIDNESDIRIYNEQKINIAQAVVQAFVKIYNLKRLTDKEELTLEQYRELKEGIEKVSEENERQNKVIDAIGQDIAALSGTMMIYNYIDENMPEWARETIQKLVSDGILKGDENGLGLTDDMLRILVILDRAGVFD